MAFGNGHPLVHGQVGGAVGIAGAAQELAFMSSGDDGGEFDGHMVEELRYVGQTTADDAGRDFGNAFFVC